ncbi:MAG: hypothetical protein RJA36_3001 [Pseudomonadota bacterium]
MPNQIQTQVSRAELVDLALGRAAADLVIENGRRLNAYAAAGAQSDHEAITLDEAIERLPLGMRLVMREGSSMSNLAQLVRVVARAGRLSSCRSRLRRSGC